MADYVTGQCRPSLWKLTSSLLALATDVKDKMKELIACYWKAKQPQFKMILVPIGSFLSLRQVFEKFSQKKGVLEDSLIMKLSQSNHFDCLWRKNLKLQICK